MPYGLFRDIANEFGIPLDVVQADNYCYTDSKGEIHCPDLHYGQVSVF